MIKLLALSMLIVYGGNEVNALNFPGPLVYVVTPSTRPSDEGRSAPFYYHNWMRRMDSPQNVTIPTTTTITPKVKTPDLIFAEFESDRMKNIRKLLERERVVSSTSTSAPIYVPEEDESTESQLHYMMPTTAMKEGTTQTGADKTDYFALYNNLHHDPNNLPSPVYAPSNFPPSASVPQPISSTTITPSTTNTEAPVNNVEHIWHIIDSEKHDQYTGHWDEVPLNQGNDQNAPSEDKLKQDREKENEKGMDDGEGVDIDDNFALPGFGTNPGNGAENESRAIRTEPNIRFPYVNLKPFQMKNSRKPINTFYNSKKGNNMYTSLDNFFEMKNPVRGEVQDIVPTPQPVDRYNPAQPYLPGYGSKSKQSSPSATPMKAVANLVPPPPPPVPKVTANDFPTPISYESFPPYVPSIPNSVPPPSPPSIPSNSFSMLQPPANSDDSGPPDVSGDNNDAPPIDISYNYQPPSPPQNFLPTLPPLKKPYGGYSYEKPPMTADTPSTMNMDDKPDFQGYHYDKPAPMMPDKPDIQAYHYNKREPPAPPIDHPPSYGPYGPPSHGDEQDYPELIYDKPHGGMGDVKGGDDMKGDGDMGMVPPPAPPDMMKPDMDMSGPPMPGSPMSGAPMDDHGFPSDFKFHHDFDDHDFYHHHHPTTTTTTTTTTEMPRVNRYSYYYLGKKLYYLPLYFSVYFIIYVGALIIKAVLRHKIVYPNSFRPNDQAASFFSKRSVDSWDLSNENLHEVTGKVTHAIATAAEKYMKNKETKNK